MIADVCPYLMPSMRSGQTWWTRYRMPAEADWSDTEAALFAAGVRAAERVRGHVARGQRLACEVVAMDWRDSRARQRTILGWPHWALKLLYTPLGVMTGKFDPGSPYRVRDGSRVVVPPPALVLALRAAIPSKDHQLLARTPELARSVSSARDDGRCVWDAVPDVPATADAKTAWPTVRAWTSTLPHHEPNER